MRTSTLQNGVMWMMMAIRDDGYDIGCTNLVQMISNVYRFYQNQKKISELESEVPSNLRKS